MIVILVGWLGLKYRLEMLRFKLVLIIDMLGLELEVDVIDGLFKMSDSMMIKVGI